MLIHQHYEMELIQKQNELKSSARAIADELVVHSTTKYEGLRIHDCADRLTYDKDPFSSRIITKGSFCRHRLCPICQWRRSCKYTAIFHKLFDNYPTLNGQHWIYLTLTQQNCHVTELRAALERMSIGFQRLRRQAFWVQNVLGAVRFTEVTHQASDIAYAHPHYHCLLMVRPSMSQGNNYVSIEAWQELWQRCLGVGYIPDVHATCIRPPQKLGYAAVRENVINTVRYSTKPVVGPISYDWLAAISRETRSLRKVELYGELRNLRLQAGTGRNIQLGDIADDIVLDEIFHIDEGDLPY